jgi:hypothetical protein
VEAFSTESERDGSWRRRISVSFTSPSFVHSRLAAVFRFTMKPPLQRFRPQPWVTPRNVNVSGLPAPRFCLFSAANRLISIGRVFSGATQAELLHPPTEVLEEALGIAAVLESYDEVVGLAHDDHVAGGGFGPPLLDPQIEHIVQ